jgi:hypothetical protein
MGPQNPLAGWQPPALRVPPRPGEEQRHGLPGVSALGQVEPRQFRATAYPVLPGRSRARMPPFGVSGDPALRQPSTTNPDAVRNTACPYCHDALEVEQT